MKKLYFLIMFFIGFTINAQIINFPDANFKKALLDTNKSGGIALGENENPLNIDANGNGEIEVSEAKTVFYLNIASLNSANVTNVSGIENFTNLIDLNVSYNNIVSLDLRSLTNLKSLACIENPLKSVNLNGLSKLENLNAGWTDITDVSFVNQLPSITHISFNDNKITNVNLNGLLNIKSVMFNNNLINSFNLTNCPKVEELIVQNNMIPKLEVNQLMKLTKIKCNNNLLTELDVTNLKDLNEFTFSSNPPLVRVFMKNGKNEYNIDLNGLTNLKFICADESQIALIQNEIVFKKLDNCTVNSYCSFNPGSNFYTLEGTTKIDIDKNGCDADDFSFHNMKFSITDGTIFGEFISGANGNYSFPVQEGKHTITAILDNPNYYTVSPANYQVNFPTESNPYNQNFCITPNGSFNDLEIAIIPTSVARPGFDATYKIIYKNVGTTALSGEVNFYFNDDVSDFETSNTTLSKQTLGTLTWDYSDLKPLETREISLTLNINSPMETPAVNIDDVLSYSTAIFPLLDDETPSNNGVGHRQTVVGSYDPNDKTCLEGNVVSDNMIGEYVNYLIRFENTGTFRAENVVVKDMIDVTKFDISTLIPVNSSHSYITRITDNKVEFIFEQINLPFDDANNDGYIAFKIKTKPTLKLGDTFENTAEIFFDYNFPIITNTASTTISNLGTQDFEFSKYFKLYPNPVADFFTINSKNNVKINSLSIYNTLGQLLQVITNPLGKIDVSQLKTGNYFMKLNTEKGIGTTRFVKK